MRGSDTGAGLRLGPFTGVLVMRVGEYAVLRSDVDDLDRGELVRVIHPDADATDKPLEPHKYPDGCKAVYVHGASGYRGWTPARNLLTVTITGADVLGVLVVDYTHCTKCQDRPGKDGLGRVCKPCQGTGFVKAG